jgi:hypothetical protein
LIALFARYLSSHCVEEEQGELEWPGDFEAAMTPQSMNADAYREVAHHSYSQDCDEMKNR